MPFDVIDAALVALQNQDSMASLPGLPEADQGRPLLDAAMLAGASAPPAAEASVAAIVAALGVDFDMPGQQQPDFDSLLADLVAVAEGEALLAAEHGIVVAACAMFDMERTDPNLASPDSDFVLGDVVLPPPEDELVEVVLPGDGSVDPFGPLFSDERIIVTGTRIRLYFMPDSGPPEPPPVQGDTPVLEPAGEGGVPESGDYVYEIIALGLKITMPAEEWNQLNQAQKNALFFILDNYTRSPNLEAALKHLKDEGVEVVIRFGARGWEADGTRYDFAPGDIAQYSTLAFNDAATDLEAGTNLVISFNPAHSQTSDGDWFGLALIHELLHPFVPDTLQNDGQKIKWDDHDRVKPMAQDAWELIFPGETFG